MVRRILPFLLKSDMYSDRDSIFLFLVSLLPMYINKSMGRIKIQAFHKPNSKAGISDIIQSPLFYLIFSLKYSII